MNQKLLHLNNISKSFGGTQALKEVSLSVACGEVLALVGENGAGKSTLMKVLAGVHTPDSGQLLFEGKERVFLSAREAIDAGICLIHQELNLCDNLSIAENIFLGREPRRLGLLHRKRMQEEAECFLEKVGLARSAKLLVEKLSTAEKQLVEIARAISMDSKVVVMDEPTSSLTATESARLFEIVRELEQQDIAVIYISHRLPEIVALAGRAVVLRDGVRSGELRKDELSRERLIELMAGESIGEHRRAAREFPIPCLEVSNLRTQQFSEARVSLSVRAGEIVGLAGLVGAGRSAFLETLFGLHGAVVQGVSINGKVVAIDSPRDAIKNGIAFVPEDRKEHGLVLDLTISQNLLMAQLFRLTRIGVRRLSEEKRVALHQFDALSVKAASLMQSVRELSGGNQQKVVLGKWLATAPLVLLLDEPTRGVDVGAKEEIYSLLELLADTGIAICMASSDQEELLRICDRIVVMCDGEISGEVQGDGASENSILSLAIQDEAR
jgi:ribose transport system ATP-binding protein